MPKFAQDILKDVEMDEEFKEIVKKYADKEPTPMEMDLKVRMDRVVYVLNRTLATIKVMVSAVFYFSFIPHASLIFRCIYLPCWRTMRKSLKCTCHLQMCISFCDY